MNKKKIAVILFNLGGPDSLESVKPFLFNLFNDKYIIGLPSWLRRIVAWIISTRRNKTAKEIYQMMGGKSTILPETNRQAVALREYLKYIADASYEVFVCMRHWHPMIEDVMPNIESYKPDEIIILPLYPQFSTTTTLSFLDLFQEVRNKSSLKNTIVKTICCYPTDEIFIKSHVNLIYQAIDEIQKSGSHYRVLFSAHGLPKKTINEGDPYQYQVEASVESITRKIVVKDLDYRICYQSKVGPLEWIGPSTEDEVEQAAKEGINLILVPIAFVSEHSETLVELDIEYKAIAESHGISYYRVPTLSIDELFIKSLGEIVLKASDEKKEFTSCSEMKKICKTKHSKCPCNIV